MGTNENNSFAISEGNTAGTEDRTSLADALTAVMDIGELLLRHGAETSRVEDTISRLGRRYGFERVDVFSITSSIVVSAFTGQGEVFTQTRRIRERDTELGIVSRANALSRLASAEDISPEQLRKMAADIRQTRTVHLRRDFCMYLLISASLSMFFGGTFRDAAAAMLSGVVLYASVLFCSGLKMNPLLMNAFASVLAGAAAVLTVVLGIGEHPDRIMIGNIMLVIPGIQLTTSLRDMISGETISGLLNLIEALLKAFFVAAGFAIVMEAAVRIGGM